MPGEFLSPEAMRRVVTRALSMFAERDMDLLHVGVQEETLAHRVAVYIECRVKGWHVDCEYNRNLKDPKMRANEASRMRPDIIVHKRNSPSNLLVVEIKKSTHSKIQRTEARERVHEFTGKWTTHPQYCHGVVLVFPVRKTEAKEVACEWFHRASFGGDPTTGTMSVPLIAS